MTTEKIITDYVSDEYISGLNELENANKRIKEIKLMTREILVSIKQDDCDKHNLKIQIALIKELSKMAMAKYIEKRNEGIAKAIVYSHKLPDTNRSSREF